MTQLFSKSFSAISIKGIGTLFSILDATPGSEGLVLTVVTGINKVTIASGYTLVVDNLTLDDLGSLTIGRLRLEGTGEILLDDMLYIHSPGLDIMSQSGSLGVGIGTLQNSISSTNTAIGHFSSINMTNVAGNNVGVGLGTLIETTTGGQNTAMGYFTMNANTTGGRNTAVGLLALADNITGSNNVALGDNALFTNTASDNTAIGSLSSISNVAGTRNTAVGRESMKGVSGNDHSDNTAIGYQSLLAVTTGGQNVAVGSNALSSNTSGLHNIAIGYNALLDETNGSDQVAIGDLCLTNMDGGIFNTAVGAAAMGGSTGTGFNSAFGSFALSNSTGVFNTGFGYQAARAVTTGTNNVAVGRDAAEGLTTGSNNTVLGSQSGDSMPAAQNNCILLNNDGSTVALDGEIHLGNATDQSLTFVHCPLVTDRVTASTGAGSIPVTGNYHELTTTGADALTLADGTVGQRLDIIMVSESGIGTVTPDTFASGSDILFTTVAQTAQLLFSANGGWYFLGGTAGVP